MQRRRRQPTLFKYKNNTHTKSELVIFLRPVVIRDASLEGDFHEFKAAALRDGALPSDTVNTAPAAAEAP